MENNTTEHGKKEYSRLNNKLRRTTEEARDQWWNDKCEEFEEQDKRGRVDLPYNEVRQLTKTEQNARTKNFSINNKTGELVTEMK